MTKKLRPCYHWVENGPIRHFMYRTQFLVKAKFKIAVGKVRIIGLVLRDAIFEFDNVLVTDYWCLTSLNIAEMISDNVRESTLNINHVVNYLRSRRLAETKANKQ